MQSRAPLQLELNRRPVTGLSGQACKAYMHNGSAQERDIHDGPAATAVCSRRRFAVVTHLLPSLLAQPIGWCTCDTFTCSTNEPPYLAANQLHPAQADPHLARAAATPTGWSPAYFPPTTSVTNSASRPGPGFAESWLRISKRRLKPAAMPPMLVFVKANYHPD